MTIQRNLKRYVLLGELIWRRLTYDSYRGVEVSTDYLIAESAMRHNAPLRPVAEVITRHRDSCVAGAQAMTRVN